MEDINYIKHLNGVFLSFSKDNRLNPTHISLYLALFQIWNEYHFKETFFIDRAEVMQLSKVGSKTTYHRCIKELSHWNYILYLPSHNPFRGSKVKLFNFGTSDVQVLYPSCTNMETGNGQAVVSKTKHIQTEGNKTNNKKPENFKNTNSQHSKTENKQVKTVPYMDNLGTISDKNYDEPL